MHSEIYGEFSLIGKDFEPKIIARTLAIDSGVAFRNGEPIPGMRRAKRMQTGWELKSTLPRSHSLSDHIRAVLSVVHPKRALIQQLARQFTLEATVCGVVYSYNGDRPPLVLEPDDVQQIAELGAGFWIDLFIIHDDNECDVSSS